MLNSDKTVCYYSESMPAQTTDCVNVYDGIPKMTMSASAVRTAGIPFIIKKEGREKDKYVNSSIIFKKIPIYYCGNDITGPPYLLL